MIQIDAAHLVLPIDTTGNGIELLESDLNILRMGRALTRFFRVMGYESKYSSLPQVLSNAYIQTRPDDPHFFPCSLDIISMKRNSSRKQEVKRAAW